MRIFINLTRETGFTWVNVEGCTVPDEAMVGGPLTFWSFWSAVCRCTSLVAWDVEAKMRAICQRFDKVIPPSAVLIDMSAILGSGTAAAAARAAAAQRDARGVAAQYFEAGPLAVGLLPTGCAPSGEQWGILGGFEPGDNIVCRAVAGAGKTTTLLLCARRRPAAACLLLTYNKRLQLDVAKRVQAGAAKIDVFTYHAAAGRAYGCVVRNDEVFRRCIQAPPENPLRFGVLMLDEAQDMALEYYVFVRYLLRANPGAQVVVVGDELQAINEYRGARPEFLTEAPALYAGLTADRPWVHRRLSVSHRLTPATAAFVNTHLYGANLIVGGNRRDPDRRPIYIAARGKAGVTKALAAAVKQAVEEFGAESVFVLAASVRNLSAKTSPLAELVRRHLAGIPTYVAGGDDEIVDAELIRGKLAILSFNAVKGCERPCVVALGIDETYFAFYERAWDRPNAVPNVITVAATRASALLIIVADAGSTMRTVVAARLGLLADVRGRPGPPRVKPRPALKPRHMSVTALLRHQHPETVRAALQRVLVLPVVTGNPGDLLAETLASLPPSPTPRYKVRFGQLVEDLSFVYGIIAPVLAEVARCGTTDFGADLEAPTIVATEKEVRPLSSDITAAEFASYPVAFWENVSAAALTDCADRALADWGHLAVARHALWEGRHHIARQVADYSWIEAPALDAGRDTILAALAGIAGDFEVRLPEVAVGTVILVGRADFVEVGGIIWEFKFTDELREEHVLQLACYLALNGGGDGILLSLLGREARRVYVAPEDADALLFLLAEKTRDPAVDIFALIDRFDRGVLNEGGGGGGEPLDGNGGGGGGDGEPWSVDDVY